MFFDDFVQNVARVRNETAAQEFIRWIDHKLLLFLIPEMLDEIRDVVRVALLHNPARSGLSRRDQLLRNALRATAPVLQPPDACRTLPGAHRAASRLQLPAILQRPHQSRKSVPVELCPPASSSSEKSGRVLPPQELPPDIRRDSPVS